MTLQVNGCAIATDDDGFLKNLEDWNPDVGNALARQESIIMSDAHWEVIDSLKRFYQAFQVSPAMRPLVKYIAKELGPEKGKSIYLMRLFPPSPARVAAKIAGLPRPDNCL